nr:hypothetical protein [Cellulosimicrobium sp. MM]
MHVDLDVPDLARRTSTRSLRRAPAHGHPEDEGHPDDLFRVYAIRRATRSA